jgi:type VI secretion system protein ImpA
MPLREDLLAPISGANPSGKNLKYDRVFDAIKESRREDIDVNQGDWKTTLKTADWPQVIKLAGEALAKRSKDLQLAAWLVDAHVRREGFEVLAPSFVLLQSLLEEFWDTLYPELEDGDTELRSTPLEWLGNKLPDAIVLVPITSAGLSWSSYQQSRLAGYEQDANTEAKKKVRQQAIADGKPTAEDFDEAVNATPREFYDAMESALAPALEELEKLNTLCDEKFASNAPSLVKIRTLLENILQQARNILKKKPAAASVTAVVVEVTAPAPAPEPAAPAPVPVVTASVTVAQAPVQPVVVTQVSGDPTGLDDAIKRTGAICRWLREKTIYDAAAFLMIRALRWGELRAKAPEIVPAMLEAPPTEVRAGIKQPFVAGSWDAVLNATESAMELPCGRAWLDLQRYTVLALEAKGVYYAGVAVSIRKALRDLLEEFPALLEQTLNDDTPVANPETRAWINEFVLSGAPLAAPVAVAAPPTPVVEQVAAAPAPHVPLEKPPELEPEEQVPGDVFDQALAAARANRSAEALDLIYKQLAAERSGRGRFRRRTQLAHLLMASGHEKIASPILQELAGEIEQRRLDDWERGEALAYPVELLIRCLDSNGADSADQNKLIRKQLYDRLCRLDPVRALQWSAP